MTKKLLLLTGLLWAFSMKVSAASLCSYDEQIALNQKAANIRHNYVIDTKTIAMEDKDIDIDYFKINILNLSEEFYAIITNDVNSDQIRIDYDDTTDGNAFIEWTYADTVTSFTIKIYSSSKTGCPDEVYKTLYLTTPRYNSYFFMGICDQARDFSLCQEYVTFDDIDLDTFLTRTEAYINGSIDKDGNPKDDEDNFFDKLMTFLDDYKWVIFVVALIGAGTATTIYIIKTKKQKEPGV